MKPFIVFIFINLSYLTHCQKGEVDLFIFAGQSNAQGYTSFANSHQPDHIDQQIMLYYNNFYTSYNSTIWSIMNKQPGGLNNNYILGPEWQFARLNTGTGRKTAIYKCAIPGTSLLNDWKKPNEGGLYDQMIIHLDDAILKLHQLNYQVNIKGFIWIQGEYDATSTLASQLYESNLTNLINHFRKKYGINFPVIIGVDEQYPAPFINKILEAQGKISYKKKHIGIISLEGLQKYDNTHLTLLGNINLGERLFKIYESLKTREWQKTWTNAGTSTIGNKPHNFNDYVDFARLTDQYNSNLIHITNGEATVFKFENLSWTPLKIDNCDNLLNYNHFYYGDYDGDGLEEILAINLTGRSSILKLINNNFLEIWSDNAIQNNDFQPYRRKIVVGDFDGDGKDEIICSDYPNGWLTMFKLINGNLQWIWSDYGDNSIPIRPYRNNLRAIDINGDGTKEILGFAGWATLFSFENNLWQWKWSTNGANNFNGWSYPLNTEDILLIGNFDEDNNDELFFIQTQSNGQWATTMEYNQDINNWNWIWSANPLYSTPYLFDHSIKPSNTNTKYLHCNINHLNRLSLVTIKKRINNVEISIFENGSFKEKSQKNFEINDNDDLNFKKDKMILYPNPAVNEIFIKSKYMIKEIEIIDITKGVIMNENSIQSTIYKVNISNLTKGLYLTKVKLGNGETIITKFLKH